MGLSSVRSGRGGGLAVPGLRRCSSGLVPGTETLSPPKICGIHGKLAANRFSRRGISGSTHGLRKQSPAAPTTLTLASKFSGHGDSSARIRSKTGTNRAARRDLSPPAHRQKHILTNRPHTTGGRLALVSNNFRGLVPKVGLEPTCLSAADFESAASTIPPLGPLSAVYPQAGGASTVPQAALQIVGRKGVAFPDLSRDKANGKPSRSLF